MAIDGDIDLTEDRYRLELLDQFEGVWPDVVIPQQRLLLCVYALGGTLKQALACAGCSNSTFSKWRGNSDTFDGAWKKAKALALPLFEGVLDDWVLDPGADKTSAFFNALRLRLMSMDPKRFCERGALEHSGDRNKPVGIEILGRDVPRQVAAEEEPARLEAAAEVAAVVDVPRGTTADGVDRETPAEIAL